ncbi:hypothetical protein [Tenacibaculum piscium]|uniref:hypothetical protein n=1 Tax=Tenacibaculum piscium TaxID=1458515 RepID=UPI001F228131|nr:hypothetical protein [Tenacibaculum piscium]
MELDKYKKAWRNQSKETNNVSKTAIYKMAHARSSSIVKWIFIIGILEFLFWLILNLFTANSKYLKIYQELGLTTIIDITYYIHYTVIAIFLYAFYKNYASISISDTTKILIKKILNTRKTVKYYVYFNLIYMILVYIVLLYCIITDLDVLIAYYKNQGITPPTNKNQLSMTLIIGAVTLLSVMFGFLWIFYRIIYGTLIRKLNKNYKELTKFE